MSPCKLSSFGRPIEEDEAQPLVGSLSEAWVSRAWFAFTVAVLAASWCVLDSWNHDMSSQLFRFSEQGKLRNSALTDEPFKYALTLAFLQFSFAGIVFCALYAMKASTSKEGMMGSLQRNVRSTANWRWPSLVVTHLFSSFVLQSVMMPGQMMSLSFFAATRAVEIPTAAAVRGSIFKLRCGGHAPHTVLAMFAGAWLLFFSYSQIAECLCIWSGFGVSLTGVPLYLIYALLLTVPATNVVLQESVLTHLDACPLFMLGVSNASAALLSAPMLIGAHLVGYENVVHALKVLGSHPEAYMTVVWLCIGTVLVSSLTVCLTLMVDSFWTISARSLRVVFWWCRQMLYFYLSSGTLLSIAQPHAALWSFGIVCGVSIGLSAFVTDTPTRHEEDSVKNDLARQLTVPEYGKFV